MKYPSERLPEWHLQAACRGADPDLFFPAKGDSAAAAKSICAGCDVQSECLDEAVSQKLTDDWGVWGGTSPRERRKVRQSVSEPEGVKRCSKCWTVKPHDAFYKSTTSKDGLVSWCRSCRVRGNRDVQPGSLPVARGFDRQVDASGPVKSFARTVGARWSTCACGARGVANSALTEDGVLESCRSCRGAA